MFVHLFKVDGERGEAEYEEVVGPFEYLQLTYGELRETDNGNAVAEFHGGYWWVSDQYRDCPRRPYSDIVMVEKVSSVVEQ